MKLFSILIIEPSYIIRKGITSIIKNYNKNFKVYAIENLLLLNDFICKTPINLIIINECLMQGFNTKLIHDNHIDLIYLVSNNHKNKLAFNKKNLNLYDDKSSIINKLETLLKQQKNNPESLLKSAIISNREKEIVKLVASGLTNKEIADQLYISTHTVITHRKNISNKLGIKSISGLTVYAVLNKIVELKDLT